MAQLQHTTAQREFKYLKYRDRVNTALMHGKFGWSRRRILGDSIELRPDETDTGETIGPWEINTV